MDVTAITRRRNPILTSFISQVTPSESSVIRRVAMEPVFLNHLRNVLCDPRRQARVDARAADQPLCGDRDPVRARRAGDGSLARAPSARRRCIVLPASGSSRSTRTSTRTMPTRCSGPCPIAASRSTIIQVIPHKDPGHGPRGPRDNGESASVLINALLKSRTSRRSRCRKREFMENAKALWERLGLPPLKPESPWHGYDLGYWPAELARQARARRAQRIFRAWRGACKAAARRRRDEYAGRSRQLICWR